MEDCNVIKELSKKWDEKHGKKTLITTTILFLIIGTLCYAVAGVISIPFSFCTAVTLTNPQLFGLIIKVAVAWTIIGGITGALVGLDVVQEADPLFPLPSRTTYRLLMLGIAVACFSSVIIALFIYQLFKLPGIISLQPAALRLIACLILGFFTLSPVIILGRQIHSFVVSSQLKRTQKCAQQFFSIKP